MTEPLTIIIISLIISALTSFLVSSIRIGVYKNKVDSLCEDVKEHKKEIREIRDMAVECKTSLKEREPLVSRRNPLVLSDKGKAVLTESGGKAFIDGNLQELKEKLNALNMETAYDIQESSKSVIDEMKDDKRLNPIKEYLFKEGREIEEIVLIFGIYLRDIILKEMGIEITEIDKHEVEEN